MPVLAITKIINDEDKLSVVLSSSINFLCLDVVRKVSSFLSQFTVVSALTSAVQFL